MSADQLRVELNAEKFKNALLQKWAQHTLCDYVFNSELGLDSSQMACEAASSFLDAVFVVAMQRNSWTGHLDILFTINH